MALLNDPLIGELLDDESEGKLLFGRMPAHEWFKPLRVTLEAGPGSSSQGVALQDFLSDILDHRTKLEFAIPPPWSSERARGPRVRPSDHILDQFIGLASAP